MSRQNDWRAAADEALRREGRGLRLPEPGEQPSGWYHTFRVPDWDNGDGDDTFKAWVTDLPRPSSKCNRAVGVGGVAGASKQTNRAGEATPRSIGGRSTKKKALARVRDAWRRVHLGTAKEGETFDAMDRAVRLGATEAEINREMDRAAWMTSVARERTYRSTRKKKR